MKRCTAQSILEYCLFISIIVAVFGAMSLYAKRGIQATLKVQGDVMGYQMDTKIDQFDEDEQDLYLQADPKTEGANVIKSMSRERIAGGKYEEVSVSTVESSYGGINVGQVMKPEAEDVRLTPSEAVAASKRN